MNAITPRQRTIFQRLVQALEIGAGPYDISDVMRALQNGDAQVWTGDNDSIVVTELLRAPRALTMRYWIAAGELDDMIPMLPKLEAWGRERGATMAEGIGRRGWYRQALAHGYRAEAMIYRKDL